MIMMCLQFLLGQLLAAIALSKVLGLMMGNGFSFVYCFFDEGIKLLICHHYRLFYI
jgi:hypothetical protein